MIRLRRIQICYTVLPEQEHRILKLLYEDGLKWDAVQKEMGIRRNSIGIIRDKAFDMIRSEYALFCPSDYQEQKETIADQQGDTHG